MTRLCNEHKGINLAQGFPDFSAPEEIKDAACKAIHDDINQYAITWGAKNLRDAIAEKTARYNGISADPEKNVTVCCGSTEAMISTMLATVDPGDEVVVFEPFYENYGPDADSLRRHAALRCAVANPDWTFDRDELAAAFNNHTRAIILNTPNNPTGKVFSRDELDFIARLCAQNGTSLPSPTKSTSTFFTTAREHIPMATLDGMRDRTITINGLSKTYSVTGWRVGWCHRAAKSSPTPSAKCTTSSPSARPRRCRRPAPSPCACRRVLLRAACRRLLAAQRDLTDSMLEAAGFRLLQARRRLLHHDGHLGIWFPRRHLVCARSRSRCRRCRRSGKQLLQR